MTPPHPPLLSASLAALRGSRHLHHADDTHCREVAVRALTQGQDALWRRGRGHLTASAFIVDPIDRVLLTHHPKYNQWQQLGGHLEDGDVSLSAAAQREAHEESGLQHLTVVAKPVQLTAISVPCPEPQSWHFDVRYAILTTQTDYTVSEESLDLRWFTLDEMPQHDAALVVGARRAVQAANLLRA